jgi:hypothetical protein
MAKKFEKTGNYFVITDSVSAKVEMERPTKDIYYKDNNNTIVFNDIIHDNLIGEISGYPFGFVNATGSVTINSVTPTKASGTITLASAVANAFATNTAQCTSVIAGDTITVNGLLYTAVAGAKADDTEFSVDTSDTACAADLADSINNDVRVGTLGDVSASPSTDTVTLTTDVEGTAGDAVTLAETGGTITLGGATFSGGVDADTVTVNGLVYTAVAGAKADDTEFSIDTSDDAAATDLADSITNDTRTGTLNDVTAASVTDTVTATQTVGGTEGDATTLVSSNGTRLAVSGATFSGGLDDAEVTMITVDSVDIMSGAETAGEDADALAAQVAANITAHTSTPNYTATANGAVITILAVTSDTSVNGFVVATTVVKATKTDVNMAGATANIVDSGGTEFATKAALITFLRANTGA